MADQETDNIGIAFLYIIGLVLIAASYPWYGIVRQAFGIDGVFCILIAVTAYAGYRLASHVLTAIAVIVFAAAIWTAMH
ncbi:MAG: hypothetical protein ACLPP2_02435 [Thermoplasmata archaeon]